MASYSEKMLTALREEELSEANLMFEEALKKDAGIPLKASTREKLQKKDAGLLAELKEAILESDKTIEQERLL